MSTTNIEKKENLDKSISTRVTFHEYVELLKIASKYNVRLSELIRKVMLRVIKSEFG